MALPLIPLLQRQLETTLQVLISVSSEMTNDDIMLLRIRLHEAALIMGDIVVERSNSAANDEPNSLSHSAAAAQDVNTVTGNSGRNHVSSTHNSSGRGVIGHPSRGRIRRPVTRSSTRVNSAIRGLPGARRAGNGITPLIEMDTDSDED